MATQTDISTRLHEFMAACERLGLKVTHQRLEIFRVVASTQEHPDAISVHRRVKKRIPTVSLDTVYRNLKLLASHGLINVVGLSQESARFDGNTHPHHHFACVQCGLIRDFSSESAGAIMVPGEAQAYGKPLSVHLEVKGICVACQKSARHD